jgi:uncharacterized phiE125 gp8 family phage protein
MPFITVISPLGQPLHIDEAKAHLRVDGADENPFILAAIASAVSAVESRTHHQLLHARFKHTQDQFTRSIRLPHGNVANVVSVQYLDLAGVVQTVPAADYIVNHDAPTTLTPVFGATWPAAMPQASSVFVTYEAGYASPISAQSGTGNLIVNGPYAYSIGQRVTFSNSGGALPAPLATDAAYLIASVAGNTYTLTDTAGAAITFTTAGTGRSFIGEIPAPLKSWMLLRVGSLFESREETAPSARTTIEPMPFVDGLLAPYLMVEY